MSGPGNGAKAAELEKSLGDEMVDDVIEDVPLELQVKDAEKGEKDKAQNAPVLGPPPNGGLDAWLPVVGSFFMHFIVIGSVYTWYFLAITNFEVKLTDTQIVVFRGVFQRFYLADNTFPGTTSTMYALVGSFGSFTGFGSGPIVGAISTKLGNRTTAGIGAILFALNFIAASYAVEYWTILLTQGILFGFCGMLAWIPAVSPPAQWFSTKRGLAMGICVSGAGFGGLALGPLTQLMLDKLGWRWALRIWGIGGGIVCAICASLLKMRVNPPGQIDLFAWFKGKKNAVAPVATGPKPPLIDVSLFKAYKFNILFLACFWAFFGVNLPYYFGKLVCYLVSTI